jgi:hypothetical protein
MLVWENNCRDLNKNRALAYFKSADFRPIWTWNTHELFVYIKVEYFSKDKVRAGRVRLVWPVLTQRISAEASRGHYLG